MVFAFSSSPAMEPDFSREGEDLISYDFAFNSSNFSDRVLRIEIMADKPEVKDGDDKGCSTVTDRAHKRPREDIRNEKDDDSHIRDSSLSNNDSSGCMKVVKVESVYVNSAILAGKSPFFYKLFYNGMRESNQQHATLRINASEEAAFMELLSFIYKGKLSTTSTSLLMDLLIASDKFEVASCTRHCSQLLKSLPMTKDSALIFLDLPSSILMTSVVQPLIETANEFLANMYKDMTNCEDEIMSLPLAGFKAILTSNDLQVASEDALYDFVIKWARAKYPDLDTRRVALGSLIHLIRFPNMTYTKLGELLTCRDLDHEIVFQAIVKTLILKADAASRSGRTYDESIEAVTKALISKADAASRNEHTHDEYINRCIAERAYKEHPVKVVWFERPHPGCTVYLDLKREDCCKLFPSGRAHSQVFWLGGQRFFLCVQCIMDGTSHYFALSLGGGAEKGSFRINTELAARKGPSGAVFVSERRATFFLAGRNTTGPGNSFSVPWTSLVGEYSPYIINGFLHLRAELLMTKGKI